LSVRDARRLAPALRDRLAGHEPSPPRQHLADAERVLTARKVVVTYGSKVAVREVDVELHRGEIVALMGRNGCGKSSLMWSLQGTGRRSGGSVEVIGRGGAGLETSSLPPAEARRHVGLVPQTPGDLLYLTSVAEECEQADRDASAPTGTCAALLGRLVPGIDPSAHPRDLSEGQRLSLVLAIQLSASPPVILLDEPTRGLDYHAKSSLSSILHELAADGHSVMVSTHDVEFVAGCADRVIVMAEGEVVADGPTPEVVVASPAFAPQVAKILAPAEWLTVDQVRTALAEVIG
jgi:energy-coupling factor transport system ATP-binding protein